jgi:hypothetical protein
MVLRMKMTLEMNDTLIAELDREAARQGTIAELIEGAVRPLLLDSQRKQKPPPSLPTFNGGGELVDIADRDALYRAMQDYWRLRAGSSIGPRFSCV